MPLFAGELHYWRVNPARWATILDRFRDLGLHVVASYIPWQYHELTRGSFDFTGRTEPARNLVGFLDLLQQRDFWVFIRPGPFIYAEWVNAGVPDRVALLRRISPEYRAEAALWMAAVTDVLKPHFATNGGRIVLFQPDNEMDLFSHWFEGPCGLDGSQPGDFHEFLQQTYGDVEALNAAWKSDYARIADAQAFAGRVNASDPALNTRFKDYWRFQHWATVEGVRWHVQKYRELGVDLPIVANFYAGGDVQNWRALAKVVDLLGIDWYPRYEFGGEPAAHRRFLDTCRYQRALSPIAFIAEFECGVWHGYHEHIGILKANQYRLTAFAAMVAGVQAFNWYMFCGRDNWYFCPVNERGELRGELAEVFDGIHRVMREVDPGSLTKQTDTCVMVEAVHLATDGAVAGDAVLQALYEADIDYEIFDPEVGRIEKPLMFYTGADWLPRASQARLGRYMEEGGTLVVARAFPQRDEHFEPCNLLDVRLPDRILSHLGKKVELDLGGHKALTGGDLWNWDAPPGEPIWGSQVAMLQRVIENADVWMRNYIGRRWICGYRQPRGRGSLVVLGLPINAAVARAVHHWLGVSLYAQAEVPGVHTALYRRGEDHFLFATNMNQTDVRVRVRIEGAALPASLDVTDLWTRQDERASADSVSILLEPRSGGAWKLRAASA